MAAHSSWDFINKGSRYLLLDTISKGLEPVLVLLCAKLYAGGEWGYFKYYESIVLLLMRIAVIGLDRGVVWIYSKRGSDESFGRAFSRAVNFVFLFAVLLSLFSAAQWLGWLPAIGKFNRASGALSWIDVSCYLVSLPAQTATLLFLQAFVNKQALMPVMVLRNVITPLAIFGPAVLFAFTPLKAHGIALPYLFGSCLGLALSIGWFFRVFGIPWRTWAFSAWVPMDLLRFSLPLASTDVITSFAYRLDILLLAKYVGIQAVEIYSIIMWVANTLRGIRQSFDSILLSVFSNEAPGKFTEAQKKAFNYATFIVLALQIPFVPLSMLFGNQLLTLIAPQYGTGGPVLTIAVLFNLGITVGAFVGQLIIGMGVTWIIIISQIIFFLFSVLLNLFMVPRWGLSGAAIATGTAAILSGVVGWLGLVRIGKTWLFSWEFFQPLFLGSLPLAFPFVIRFFFGIHFAVDIGTLALSTLVFAWLQWQASKRLNHRHS